MADRLQQQVTIETKFIEIRVKQSERLGIDQSIVESLAKLPAQSSALSGAAGTNLGIGAGASVQLIDSRLFPGGGTAGALNVSALITGPQMQSILNSLEGDAAVKTTSAPALRIPGSQDARIQVPSFTSGGVVLDIQPRIEPDGRVGLTIQPQVAGFSKTTSDSTVGAGEAVLLGGTVPAAGQQGHHVIILVKANIIDAIGYSPDDGSNGPQVKVRTRSTGATVGHVADVMIENLTKESLKFVVPPLILESRNGLAQDYACPHQQDVALGPNESKTIPLDGVCLDRDKPPVAKGTTDGLVLNPGDPAVSRRADCHTPGKEARDLLRLTEAKYDSVDQLQKSGGLKDFPYHDEQKQRDILLQWSTWTDPRVCTVEKSSPATKQDIEKVVYKQAGKTPSREARKKLDEGIDTIFEKVELTNEKAKSFEKPDPFTAVELTGEKAKIEPASSSAQPTPNNPPP